MPQFSKNELDSLERRFRANLINSMLGYKPANLIGSVDGEGNSNLAIFTGLVHLGADPALQGVIFRPQSVRRHTLENILETGEFTINLISEDFLQEAHCTSAKFEAGESEFESCGLHPAFREGFKAPYVVESRVRSGLKLIEHLALPINGSSMVIGEVQWLEVDQDLLTEHGSIDPESAKAVCASDLQTYHTGNKLARLDYARPSSTGVRQAK